MVGDRGGEIFILNRRSHVLDQEAVKRLVVISPEATNMGGDFFKHVLKRVMLGDGEASGRECTVGFNVAHHRTEVRHAGRID
jgi:hypothetical protein